MGRGMDESFDIEVLREAAAHGRIHWHQHALERFLERGISLAEIADAMRSTRGLGRIQAVSFFMLEQSQCMLWPPQMRLPGYAM